MFLEELEEAIVKLSLTTNSTVSAAKQFAEVLTEAFRVAGFVCTGRSNNWRKLHGFPMKRKGRRSKK